MANEVFPIQADEMKKPRAGKNDPVRGAKNQAKSASSGMYAMGMKIAGSMLPTGM